VALVAKSRLNLRGSSSVATSKHPDGNDDPRADVLGWMGFRLDRQGFCILLGHTNDRKGL